MLQRATIIYNLYTADHFQLTYRVVLGKVFPRSLTSGQ